MAEISYKKTNWVNNVTKLNADNMNHIENGIEAATVEINTLNGDLANKASIDYVDNAIASVSGGVPAFVDSVDEMTDTSKV